ncbi:MAG: hypothetical protein IJF47_02995 [Candidatus Methanomethylophilaceae archaeon]|nr:hypothetical protein [Candidatus Methanomethylophilaceae archaeon]
MHPSLEYKWSEEDIQDIFIGDDVRFGLHIDDIDPERYWEVSFKSSGGFRYNTWSLGCSVKDCDGNEENIGIMIKSNGNVAYEIDVESDEKGYARHLINELHFLVKRLLHDDVYHESDPIHIIDSTCAEERHRTYNCHPDYFLSPVIAVEEKDAVEEMDRIFIMGLDRFIKSWKCAGKPYVVPEGERRLAIGYVTFGESFCYCTDSLRDPSEILLSFELYRSAIEEFTDYTRRVESKEYSDNVNNSVIKLTVCTVALTLISIFVAYFAGSSLANVLPPGIWTLGITVTAGIITATSCYFALRKYGMFRILSKN